MKLDSNPETFQLNYFTAKQWMEYMEMVNNMRAIIRSERIGECSLHQGTPQEMLTWLTAYCHLHRVPIPLRIPKVDDQVGRHVSQCSQAVHPRSACCQEGQPILGRVVRIPISGGSYCILTGLLVALVDAAVRDTTCHVLSTVRLQLAICVVIP